MKTYMATVDVCRGDLNNIKTHIWVISAESIFDMVDKIQEKAFPSGYSYKNCEFVNILELKEQ